MKKDIPQKILSAIDSGRLKLEPWKKSWYSYMLDIQELVWSRNLIDGFDIYVYDRDWNHIETVNLEIRVVCEYWGVHNKLFLI